MLPTTQTGLRVMMTIWALFSATSLAGGVFYSVRRNSAPDLLRSMRWSTAASLPGVALALDFLMARMNTAYGAYAAARPYEMFTLFPVVLGLLFGVYALPRSFVARSPLRGPPVATALRVAQLVAWLVSARIVAELMGSIGLQLAAVTSEGSAPRHAMTTSLIHNHPPTMGRSGRSSGVPSPS